MISKRQNEILKISADSADLFLVLLGNKRLVCYFSGLNLILLSVKSTKNVTTKAFYLKDKNRESRDTRIGRDWLILVRLPIPGIRSKSRKLLIISKTSYHLT